jgi:hypothetical protein
MPILRHTKGYYVVDECIPERKTSAHGIGGREGGGGCQMMPVGIVSALEAGFDDRPFGNVQVVGGGPDYQSPSPYLMQGVPGPTPTPTPSWMVFEA